MGASDHLVLSKGNLRTYKEFKQPVEIAATNIGMIYTYGLRVATSASGIEQEVDLKDVYYTPGLYVQPSLLGKLERQGWEICLKVSGIELRGQGGMS